MALVRALLEVDDLSGLSNRVSAVGGDPDDQMGAWYRFREWFTRGIEERLPSTDPAALGLRYWRALDDVAEGTAERTRALTLDIERAGDSVAHRSLLGRALLLLTRRLVEDGDREGALEAAARAEEVLASVDDPKWHAQAIGTRAGVLIGLGQTAEARALLDSLPASWRPLFEGGRYRGDVLTASLADRLREAEAPEYEEDKLPGPFR